MMKISLHRAHNLTTTLDATWHYLKDAQLSNEKVGKRAILVRLEVYTHQSLGALSSRMELKISRATEPRDVTIG
jgi:hypothetical protein